MIHIKIKNQVNVVTNHQWCVSNLTMTGKGNGKEWGESARFRSWRSRSRRTRLRKEDADSHRTLQQKQYRLLTTGCYDRVR